MASSIFSRVVSVSLCVALATVEMAGTAEAGGRNLFGALAAGFGAAAVGILAGGRGRGRVVTRYREPARRDTARAESRPRASRESGAAARPDSANEKVLASLGGATIGGKIQVAVLKGISVGAAAGAVGINADSGAVGQTRSTESDRDYTGMVRQLVKRFTEAQAREHPVAAGDVTEYGIERALDRALASAKLERFESFREEDWSPERLKVMVLTRVAADIKPLFNGNNRGLAPMDTLDTLIQRSAEGVFRRLFESSELLAANRSISLFVKRVYEAHGGLMGNDLREMADRMLSSASNQAIGPYEAPLRRSQNGFALRYRAQRIVFDCLSENVEQITTSGKAIAEVEEIDRRTRETALGECVAWLARSFGEKGADIDKQQPMPSRVIWSAEGPKELASMYGKVGGNF